MTGPGPHDTAHPVTPETVTPPDPGAPGPGVTELLRNLEGYLRHADHCVAQLTVNPSLGGPGPQAEENRTILHARFQLARQRFEQLTARYDALQARFRELSEAAAEAQAPPAAPAVPATLRRAVALIDTRAMHDVTLDDLTAVAGVSARALQEAFRRHFDTTPLGYLRDVRYEHAHHDLLAADPTSGDTVAAIAARWRFTHLGRFARGYRCRYGVLPTHTLRT
jgi:AraC-like DNA-binding protein